LQFRRLGLAGALAHAILVLPAPVLAQGILPGEERPPLPEPRPEDEAPPLELPPVPEGAGEPLATGLSAFVARFEITGSTVFTDEELAAAVAPYAGREIISEELIAASDAVTQLYVDHGFTTSGATIPDQDLAGGVVRLEIVEGALADVEVTGNQRFRDRWFESRLARAGRAPVNVARLERALQVLQRDPWIERLDAHLEPGDRLGESRLRVRVTESRWYRLRLQADNDTSPTVGSYGGAAEGWVANLTGLHDVWVARFRGTEGLLDTEGQLEIPVTPWDTRLRLRFRDTRTEIVEDAFEDLDIEASSVTYGVELHQPVWRSEVDEVWAGLIGEFRTTDTTVLGEDFCFEPQVPDCDDPTVSVLRGSLEWTRATRSDVFAIRSLASFGIDALGATRYSDSQAADGRFVAWLGQAQWAHVLPETLRGTRTVARVDVQLANDPLLSIERFALGGRDSVRGYRENQLVRDSGVVASFELRIPVWRDALRRSILELVPFADYGYGWNDGPEPPEDTLLGVGAGLRFTPVPWLLAEIYWGGRVEDVPNPHDDLQDEGVSFRVAVDVF
jgi:hemolysin activation/secretion protein